MVGKFTQACLCSCSAHPGAPTHNLLRGFLSTNSTSRVPLPCSMNPSGRWTSELKFLILTFMAFPITGSTSLPRPPTTSIPAQNLHVPWTGLESNANSRSSEPEEPSWEGPTEEGASLSLRQVTSESGLSEESSSPEGDALWVGFERNQLNQPNPELWGQEGVKVQWPAGVILPWGMRLASPG